MEFREEKTGRADSLLLPQSIPIEFQRESVGGSECQPERAATSAGRAPLTMIRSSCVKTANIYLLTVCLYIAPRREAISDNKASQSSFSLSLRQALAPSHKALRLSIYRPVVFREVKELCVCKCISRLSIVDLVKR